MRDYYNTEKTLETYRKELPEVDSGWPPPLPRAVRCIHTHLLEPQLTVRWMRKQCRINGHNFSALFKYYVGPSPQQYIIEHRIAAGCRLLQSAPVDYPILHVALAIGFSSHSAFSRTFKRRKGVTPSEFRQLSKKC